MKRMFPYSSHSNSRVFTSCLLSFLMLMSPIASVAASLGMANSVISSKADAASKLTPEQRLEASLFTPAAPAPPSAAITATKNDVFPVHPSAQAEPGDVIDYTVDVSNTGGVDATGVTFADTVDANTTFVTGSLKVSPLAFNDTYVTAQGVALSVGAPGVLGTSPNPGFDTGLPAPSAVPIAAGPTTGGGTVTLNANGSFTYTPLPAFTGADTFTYTATNGQAPPNPGVDDVATVTINVDAAPTVTATTPTDTAINQPTNTNITITFSEPVNVTGNWFTIVCTASGTRNVADTVVTGGPTTFTINPNTDFTQAESCTVTVDDAAISDQDGNDPPDNMAADYVFSFTMDAAPAVAPPTTPASGVTGVAASTNITIPFTESVGATTSSFTIKCPSSGAALPFTLSASPASSFTLNPNSDLPAGSICEVTVIANQIADSDGNDPPNNMVGDYVFSFTIDAAPTVTSTVPTAGATIVATNTNITLNFSESVNIAAGGITLNCGAGNLAFTPALPQNGVSSIVIDPTLNLPTNTLCTVTAVATLMTDADSADPPNQLDGDANGTEGPNFVLTFTTDAAPRVTSTTPTQGATQVGASTNITLNFSESVDIAAGGITLNCGAGNLTFAPVLPQNGVSSIVINPDADLPFNTLCTVTGVAANITDVDTGDPPNQLDGNNDGTEGDNFTLTFTTDAAPSVTSTVPTNNATDIAQTSTVTINFSENVDVAAGGVTINCGSAVAFTPALPQANVSSLVLTPTAALPAGSNCTVTVDDVSVTDTDTGDPPNKMDNDFIFTFKVKPDAVNDNVLTATTQTVIGNVSFNTANIPYSATTNDVSANAFTISAFDGTSANGGTVVMTTSGAGMGQFTYNPSRGFEGADTFNYTISRTDGGGSDTATVTINVSGMIWFIQNAAVACGLQCGRLSNPYPTLGAFNTDNALAGGLNPDNNDNIFIYEHAVGYSGAVTLRSGQKLIGQDATATLASIAGVTVFSGSTALPAMDSGNGIFTNITSTVTMHNNSTVRGLRINVTGSDKGLVAVTKTGLVVNEVATISSVNGTAVDFSATSSGTFTFTNISASGSGAGLSFASTTSGSTVTVNNVTTTTGAAVTTSSTGATDFTFNDVTSTTGTALDINTATGDFIFHAITKNGGATGIDVDSATGSFTVNGTSTTAGTGGTIQNTTSHGAKFIGSNNITLKNMNLTSNAQTQSSSNINCGNNLVAGNTTLCTANLYLSSVTTISLTNLSISGSTQEGIAGTTVSGLTLANSTIENNGGEDYENGFLFKNLTGTVSITNSNIRNNFSRQGHIFNDGASVLTLNVTGTLFGRTVAPGVSSQQGLLMELQGTSSTSVDVGTSSFNNNGNGNGFQVNAASSATVGTVGTHSSIHNSTSMTNNAAHVFLNTSGSATMYFDTMNNGVMTAAVLQSIDYFANGGNLTGIIQGNTIGTNGVAASGCATALGGCDGMTIDKALTGNLSLRIESNIIQQINTNGIALGGANSGGSINASIINNTIRQPSNSAPANSQGNAMYLNMGAVNPSAFTACLNVTGNLISDTAAKTWDINGSFAMIYVRARNTATVRIPGAAAGTAAAADTHITNNNTFTRVFVPNVEPVLTEAVGGGTYANGAACSVPLLLADGGVDAISFLSALTDLATNASGDRHKLGTVSSLNQAQLDAIVAAATQRWMATGLTQQQIAAMRELRFELGDLAASYLGEASGNRIVVDRNAQGKGWFIDTTPADDVEFGSLSSATRRYTDPFTSAAGRIDLLTAIEHEIGHKLGLDDSYSEKDRDNLMYGYLTVGERRLPAMGQARFAEVAENSGPHFLTLEPSASDKLKFVEHQPTGSETFTSHASKKALAIGGVLPIVSAAMPSGETINHTIGTLPAAKKVRITFQVTVDIPFSGTQVANQATIEGTISATPFTNLTDDPGTGAPNDTTITPVLGPPDAVNDAYTTFKNTPLSIAAPGVLVNDTSSPTVSAIGGCADVTAPFSGCATTAGGTVTMNADGSFTYTPLTGYTGADSFTYTATNGAGSDTATVNITVIDFSAIYINEVLFNPTGTDAPNEYIELRGPASATIPAGTYFVGIEGDNGGNPGDVQTIINLSGLTFGSNGFLVLLQNGNTYTTAAGATVITSTTTGFGGLPGTIFTADAGTDIENDSVTFMLVQTGVAPTLTDDIDSNNDATPDGSVYAGWSVRDSIGVLNTTANGRGYGAINYHNGASGTSTPGSTVVTVAFTAGYVGRIGDSTGSMAADWVASVPAGAAPNFTLGTAVQTEPSSFAGKPLNHIGASNFVNLAPVNSVPGPQATNEDTVLTFNAANANLISISDPDAGAAAVKVTLTAVNGTMSLSGTAGLTFTPASGSNDGTNDTQMVFTGTIAAINTALDGLTFTPTPNFFSPPDGSITILTDDQGNSGDGGNKTDTDTVNITVGSINDAPTLDAIGNVTIAEDATTQTVNLSGITAGPGESQTLVVTTGSGNTGIIPNPTVTYTSPNSTGSISFAPVADQNGGPVTITVTVTDNGGTGGANVNTFQRQFTVTVTEVNDAPVAGDDALSAVDEDSGARTIPFATLLGNDTKGATNEGAQTLNITAVSNPVGGTVQIVGTDVIFTPTANFFGAASFDYTVQDDGTTNLLADPKTDTGAVSFNINSINDPPSFVKGADQTVNQDAGPQTVNGWATSISQGPGESGQTLTFNLSVTGTTGTIAFSSGPAIDPTTGDLTYTSSAATNGTATISVTLSDNGSNVAPNSNTSGAQTFTITVNPALGLTVNTVGDAGDLALDGSCDTDVAVGEQCTLRAAIQETNNAPSDDTIGFTLPANSIISLLSALDSIDGGLAINGPGANTLTVKRDSGAATDFRIFDVTATGVVTISGLTISDGRASGASPSNRGGGIFNASSGTVNVTNSTLTGNTATFGGGITNFGSGIVNVTNSTLSGNSATFGGGIYNFSTGTVNVTNSTLSGNTVGANSGGGIYNVTTGAINVTNSTVTGNSATQGGGINNNSTGPVQIKNSIIALNTAGTGPDLRGTITSQGNNIVGSTSGATIAPQTGDQFGVTAAQLRLGPLANNGGPTQTHALLSGSVALDAGNNAFVTNPPFSAPPFTDQRGTGFARIADGPDADTTQTVDIGAFEADPSVEDISDKSTNEDVALPTFVFNVGDAAQAFTNITATSDNPTLVPAGNIVVGPNTASTRTLSITPAANQFGTATITVTVTRGGQSMSDDFVLTVNAVPDQPSVTAGSTTEDTITPAGQLVISRNLVDGAEVSHFQITGITNGTLYQNDGATQIGNTEFITFVQGNAGLRFLPAPNSSANGSFTVQGSIGNSIASGPTAIATITVTGVNDQPTLDAITPNPLNLLEDAGVQNINLTGITDGGGEGQTLVVTAISTNTGLIPNPTVTYTSPNSTGSIAFTPVAGASGTADITVTVDDNGGGTETVSRTFTVNVTAVNDVPSFTKGPDQTVDEDAGAQTINPWATAISAGTGDTGQTVAFQVTGNTNSGLFAVQPTISPTGVLTYTPVANTNGSATITIVLMDDGDTANGGQNTSAPQTFTITVNAVNDAPSFTKGADQTGNEDAGLQTINNWATGISQGPGESGQTLTFNVSVTGTTGNIAFSSGPSINATTGTLTYTTSADTNGTATISVTLSDNGSNVAPNSNTSAAQTFNINVTAVNDAPSFQIPSNPPAVNEDASAQTVNGFATNFQPGPVTATDEIGQTLVGYTVTQTGTTGNLTFTSGPSINNAGTLTYTPTSNTSGTATYNAVATDSGSGTAPNVNQSAPVAFTITVNGANDAPVLDNTGNMSLNAINEDVAAASNPGTLVSDIILSAGGDRITDIDPTPVEGIAVTAVNNTSGTWQYTIDNGTNWLPFGSPDALNARLLAANANTRVRFIPNANFNGTVNPGLTFRAWDQTSGTNGGTADVTVNGGTTAYSTATETASITVNPVNDTPTANAQTVGTAEDTPVGITLTGTDVETASGSMTFTVTVLPANGTLTGTGANRTYTPNPNYNGPDSFKFTVTDTGDGASPALTSAEATISINVAAQNDAPVNTIPGAQSVNENGTLTFNAANSNLVSIADVDAGTAAVRVQLTATNGTITLSGTTGLAFTVGDGTSDTTMTFTGMITDINNALNGMSYAPNANYDGPASIQIVTNDQGNTGAGGPGSDTDTINITVIDGGTLAFSSATYTVAEDGVNATITVNRTGGSSGTATVQYTTSNGSAISGSDYTTASGTLTFGNGVTSQTFNVPITNDTLDEADETVNLTLSNPTGTGGLGVQTTAVLTITDNDPPPNMTINDVSVTEGNAGTSNAVFTVTLSAPSGLPVTVNYQTANGSANSPSDYQGVPSTLLTFNPGETTKPISIVINGDTGAEIDETFFVNLSGATNATITDNQGVGLIISDDTPVIQFTAANQNVNEGAGHIAVTVTRLGDLSQPARIDYASSDASGLNNCPQVTGNASQRCDYATVVGILRFASGEASKDIIIPIIDDVHIEGNEVFTLTLSNAVGGDVGSPNATTITIIDNDVAPAPNPIFNDAFFIRQLYIDLLGRLPEPGAVNNWLAILNNCPVPTDPINGCDRIAVAAGFLRSAEFQGRGYFVYRHYSAALGRIPLYSEFIPDMAFLNGFLSTSDLEANKIAYTDAVMNRPEFKAIYDPTLGNPTAYVDKLLEKSNLPSHPGRAGWIAGLTNSTLTRAQVLRQFIDSTEVYTKYVNEAFIIMNYFGFLRRSADAAYQAWFDIFNHTNDYRLIINGFMNSAEYRLRFGP